jgi:hypothetical protein
MPPSTGLVMRIRCSAVPRSVTRRRQDACQADNASGSPGSRSSGPDTRGKFRQGTAFRDSECAASRQEKSPIPELSPWALPDARSEAPPDMGSVTAKSTAPAHSCAPFRRWFLLLAMFLIFVGGQIDRQIMPILAQDMKQGLRITDEQLGFLLGLGFSLTYAVGTILPGSLAARTDRIRLLSSGLAFWSLLTLCCRSDQGASGLQRSHGANRTAAIARGGPGRRRGS